MNEVQRGGEEHQVVGTASDHAALARVRWVAMALAPLPWRRFAPVLASGLSPAD